VARPLALASNSGGRRELMYLHSVAAGHRGPGTDGGQWRFDGFCKDTRKTFHNVLPSRGTIRNVTRDEGFTERNEVHRRGVVAFPCTSSQIRLEADSRL